MFGRLLPRETSFFDFFESHAGMCVASAKVLCELAHTTHGNGTVVAAAKRIKELEHEADGITHRCVEALHKTFITPFDRDDIYRLITRMDDIIDFVEAAAERISLYKLREMTPEMRELSGVLVRATEEVLGALSGMREMSKPEIISAHCVTVNRLENEADAVLRVALARLFDEVEDTRTIIKWKEIYENLESAADCCEDVANIIEGLVLDHN